MTIVIFGGTGGIGAQLARRLHASGETLHLVARTEARLAELSSELSATFSVADVTDEGAARRLDDVMRVGARPLVPAWSE